MGQAGLESARGCSNMFRSEDLKRVVDFRDELAKVYWSDRELDGILESIRAQMGGDFENKNFNRTLSPTEIRIVAERLSVLADELQNGGAR